MGSPLARSPKRGYAFRVRPLALFACAFLVSSAAAKGVVHFPGPTQTFVNEPCRAAQTCALSSFSIHPYEFRVDFDEYKTHNYGTAVNIEYVTRTPASLEDFAVVNFIRGCQFYTKFNQGKVGRHYTILIGSFGKEIPYRFPDWRIDSLDVNPMYNNTPEEDVARLGTLHGSYRWNRVKDSFEDKTEVLFGDERPTTGRLYVSDRPGQAFVDDDGEAAYNISVEFRTCLYRTRDVPRVASAENVDFAAPIACHEWRSSYVYDFVRKEMTHPQKLDCGDGPP